MKEQLTKILATLPIILMLTFANTLIASVMGIATFWQLNIVLGWSKPLAEATSLLIAVAAYAYIWWQPKIRTYIT
jgi:hypothetical protein